MQVLRLKVIHIFSLVPFIPFFFSGAKEQKIIDICKFLGEKDLLKFLVLRYGRDGVYFPTSSGCLTVLFGRCKDRN